MMRILLFAGTAVAALAAVPVAAQTLPDLGNYSLPASQATPTPTPTPLPSIAAPTPAPTPTPSATPTPAPAVPPAVVPTVRPSPSATVAPPALARSPTPQPTPTTVTPSPVPTATASAAPALPASIPAPAPSPSVTPPAPPVQAAAGEPAPWWWIVGGIVVVALGVAGWLGLRRRGTAADEDAYFDLSPETPPEESAAPVAPPPPPPPVVTPRPHLTLAMRPRRAGLNLLSATADVELVVTNDGDAPARSVTVDVAMLGTRSGNDEGLALYYAEPIGRPAVPAFALAPGEQRAVRAVAALARDGMEPLVAGGRPMFVPVVAANLLYRWDGAGEAKGQSAAAWVIGIVREGSDKLAPFWLDVAPRMHDDLGAREHGARVAR